MQFVVDLTDSPIESKANWEEVKTKNLIEIVDVEAMALKKRKILKAKRRENPNL